LVPYESFCCDFLLIGFKSLSKIPKEKWKFIAMTSMGRLFRLFFALAQTEIDSSVTSILNSLTPLNTLILGALVLGLVLKEDRFGVFYWTLGSVL
jgi:drug/metabolite transporter (DMT)-like permease